MTSPYNKKQILIIGGGMAGAILAKDLANSHKVTLVDPNDYFEVPMAAPRSLVTPEFSEAAIIPFAKALPNVEVIRGALRDFDGVNSVITQHDGVLVNLQADVTVLATGSQFPNCLMRAFDSTSTQRSSFYSQFKSQLVKATKILIVGGGPIGIELAGEITDHYPNKSITILECGNRILSGTTKEASDFAKSILESRGVNIYCNERIDAPKDNTVNLFDPVGEVVTTGGKIDYDLLIWCVGGKPNTSYMKEKLSGVLNAKGQICVTPQLRVKGMVKVFALGDITDLDENKMAWHIAGQIKVASFNINQVLKDHASDSDLKIYKPKTNNPMMAVSIGANSGVLHLPVIGLIKTPWMVKLAKSGTMLVPKYRKILGV